MPTVTTPRPVLVLDNSTHTLFYRGEAFRHRRNLLGARPSNPAPSQAPSLPPLITPYSDLDDAPQQLLPPPSFPDGKLAGPSPPPSWVSPPPSSPPATPEWRARALSLTIQHSPGHSPALAPYSRIPSLFQLCLHNILIEWGGIPPELFPDLPRHILREYVRYSAVHFPTLPRADLMALWGVENAGSADGEIIITEIAPSAVLPHLLVAPVPLRSEWDTPDPDSPPALHTLVLLSSPSLSAATISLFPPTLTHLALLRVPPVALHKLPPQLPLIVVLDLSYNTWVTVEVIKRIDWRKWVHLEVLGVRECGIGGEVWGAAGVNRGRLKDLDVVLE